MLYLMRFLSGVI